MRIIILLFLVLSLQGCSLFEFLKPQDDKITLHPDLPRPISGLQIEWDVIELPHNIYIGTTYKEFLDLLEYQNNLVRYIDQINRTVCYYRQELEEDFCQTVETKLED